MKQEEIQVVRSRMQEAYDRAVAMDQADGCKIDQFYYAIQDGIYILTRYSGRKRVLDIPEVFDEIGEGAF